MRLPNGYGSVSKQSGNRTNPYVVKKTVGYNAKGYPIYKIIGYTPTREAGLTLLAKYNENPFGFKKYDYERIIRNLAEDQGKEA